MEKVRINKKQLNDLEEGVEKRFVGKPNFDDRSKYYTEKFGDFTQRLKELEKRTDIGPIFDR